MVARERLIASSSMLVEGGDGVRFDIRTAWGKETGFVVRHQGRVFGYVNRCAHVPVELDWQPGRFFDDDGVYLICSVHGALYDPASGRCIAGPCRGGCLPPLEVIERGGNIFLIESGND